MRAWFASIRNEDGQALVEYSLILALVSVAAIAHADDARHGIIVILHAHRRLERRLETRNTGIPGAGCKRDASEVWRREGSM